VNLLPGCYTGWVEKSGYIPLSAKKNGTLARPESVPTPAHGNQKKLQLFLLQVVKTF